MQPERFRIEITDEAVADLRDRLARTRWPGDYGNDDWRYGVNEEWMLHTLSYWRDEFDFAAFENALNQWEHYRVVLDDVPIHYIHARGQTPNALPLGATRSGASTRWP